MDEHNRPDGGVKPGNSIQVKVAFDVPPGTPTEGAVLELHDSMLSGGAEVQLGAPSRRRWLKGVVRSLDGWDQSLSVAARREPGAAN